MSAGDADRPGLAPSGQSLLSQIGALFAGQANQIINPKTLLPSMLRPGSAGQSLVTGDTGIAEWSSFLSTAWTEIPYATAWSSHGSSYGPPEYAKTRDGVVKMRGLAKKDSGSGTGLICTLPEEHRPPINLVFASYLNIGVEDYPCSVYVQTDGTVQIVTYMTYSAVASIAAGTAVGWVTLSTIQFDTAA